MYMDFQGMLVTGLTITVGHSRGRWKRQTLAAKVISDGTVPVYRPIEDGGAVVPFRHVLFKVYEPPVEPPDERTPPKIGDISGDVVIASGICGCKALRDVLQCQRDADWKRQQRMLRSSR